MLRARHQIPEANMNIADKKQAARKAAMAQRRVAHAAAKGAGEAAAGHMLAWLAAQPKLRVISGYMPIHTELDILPTMHELHEKGYSLCVPVIMGKAKSLKFSAWTPDTKMTKGAFGAMVPENSDWLRPDLLLCPMLAFDAKAQRMGYGGGFYDRTIAALAPVRTLGFAYAAQQVAHLPTEPTNMPLEGVITENGLISP